jgi:recombination protein RecA
MEGTMGEREKTVKRGATGKGRAAEAIDKTMKLLDEILKETDKVIGRGSVMRMGAMADMEIETTSSGSLLLDRALGVGGYPRGRVVEVFGPEASGKTTLCLHAIAEVQRAGGIAAFVDAEHALDMDYARKLGVNVDTLLLSQPDFGEQALNITDVLVKTGKVDIVVVDSVAALVPQAELDGDMADNLVGGQARLMNRAMRKLTGHVHRSKTSLFFINQIRQKIGVMFGSSETTPGGNALKFFSTMRLDIRRIQQLKNADGPFGSRTRVKVVKNKVAAPYRVAEFDIIYGLGIDRAAEVLDMAEAAGVVQKAGSWFSMGEERLGQGREALLTRIRAEAELRGRLESAVLGADEGEASGDETKETGVATRVAA